jgi:prophage regulatory protein
MSQKVLSILRLNEVVKRTGLSRSTIYSLMKSGGFPKQTQLSLRMVGWSEDSIHDWILQKLEQKRKA